MKNHLLLGNWNALCDSCGRKFKALDLQKRWDGLMVCREDFEQRHPQDLLRVQREKIAVPWSRPYAAQDTYIPENLWTKPEDHLGVNETNAFDVVKRIYDTYANTGALNGYSLNEFALNQTIQQGAPSETFVMSETFFATLGRFVNESLAATETFAFAIGKRIDEVLPIGESYRFAETEHNGDTLSFSEAQRFTMSKNISETITVTEVYRNGVARPLSDSLSLTEGVTKQDDEKTIETLSMAETSYFAIGQNLSDSVTPTENFSYVLVSPPDQFVNGSALNTTYLG